MASSEVLSFERTGDATVVLRLSGSWSLQGGLPSVAEVEGYVVSAPRPMGISFDTRRLTIWDSRLRTAPAHEGALPGFGPVSPDPGVRRAGPADHHADQLPGGRHSRLRRSGPAQAVWRPDLRRRSGRHRHDA